MVLKGGTNMTFVGEIFRNLKGSWNFNRVIQSRLLTSPGGTVTGQAKFVDSNELSSSTSAREYLYSEHGKFHMENGQELLVTRNYIYKYNQSKEAIEVYFANDKLEKDRFFHELQFIIANETESYTESQVQHPCYTLAKGEHLCEADKYIANYNFPENASDHFTIKFEVKGPHKDYTTTTQFTRMIIN